MSETLGDRGPSGPASGAGTATDAGEGRPGTAPGAGRDRAGDGSPPGAGTDRTALHPALVVGGLVGILAVPLLVALGVLANPRWYPLLDLAQTELRVRDVGSRHSPLVGLAGRIQAYGQQGSHPGPLSFWALAPFYRLYGASSWALQAASVTLHVVAMGGILAGAHRRGGARMALAFAAVLAVLTHAYGAGTLTEAWNPYMPVLWWLLFLVAIWSVLCEDLAMLPVAVFAGSFCAQTHIPYAGLVGGVAGLTVVAVAVETYRRRADRATVRAVLRWGAVAAGLGVVLWIPPVIDQLTNDPGNASMIVESFVFEPSGEPVGGRVAVETLAVHLDVWRLVSGDDAITGAMTPEGSLLPAAGLLAVWLAAAVTAWKLRHRSLVRLHALLAVLLVLGLFSLSRVLDGIWYYLVMWAWGITALMIVAIVWTGAVALRTWGAPRGVWPPGRLGPRRAALAGSLALAAVLVVWTAMFAADATQAEVPAANQSRQLSRMAPATVDALDSGDAPGGGREGSYLVTWVDPVGIGATGFGLLLELERQGFDVGVPDHHATGAVPHRVLAAEDATAEVHVSVGSDVERWRADPEAVEVATVELTEAERERYAAVRAEIVERLTDAGLDDLVEGVDDALMAVAIDPRLTPELQQLFEDLAEVGQPASVFVRPL